MIGATQSVKESVEKIMPYSYMYAAWDKNVDDKAQGQKIAEVLEGQKGYKELKMNFLALGQDHREAVFSQNMYNQIAGFLEYEKIALNQGEYYLVGTDGKHKPALRENSSRYLTHYQITASAGDQEKSIALSGYFQSAAVVSDEDYERMKNDFPRESIYAYDIDHWEEKKELTQKVVDLAEIDEQKETLASAYKYYSVERTTRYVVSYVGSILCVSFMLAIASLIYTYLYAMTKEEISKYRIMTKLGLPRSALKSILGKTVKTIYLIPFLLALTASWGFIFYMEQYVLVSYIGIGVKVSLFYVAIAILLYSIIKRKYEKKIIDAVYSEDSSLGE